MQAAASSPARGDPLPVQEIARCSKGSPTQLFTVIEEGGPGCAAVRGTVGPVHRYNDHRARQVAEMDVWAPCSGAADGSGGQGTASRR